MENQETQNKYRENNQDIVFGKVWFERHQSKLLFLLNAPVIKYWFRWVMRIRRFDCPIDTTINRITPSSFAYGAKLSEDGNEIILKEDFRTHNKFSKRLYFAFKPMWYLFHFLDWAIFDRYTIGKLNFGFLTLTVYPADTGGPTDGTVDRNLANPGEAYSSIRTGAGTDFSNHGTNVTVVLIVGATTSNQWRNNGRGVCCYDTSSLTASASISAAVLSIFGQNKGDASSIAMNIDVYSATPASTDTLANSDYGNFGTTSFTGGNPISYASWSTSTYNAFTLDSNGIANISKTGISKFGLRNENYDVAGGTPNWGSNAQNFLSAKFSATGGQTEDPKLVVTYTVSAGTFNRSLLGVGK